MKELLALKEVIEVGQIQKAALRNGLRQPNLSHLIRDLETRTGTPLFERTATGVLPTLSGRVLYGKVLSLHEQLNDLKRFSFAWADMEGTISLRIREGVFSDYFANVLSSFYKACPHIGFRMVSSNDADVTVGGFFKEKESSEGRFVITKSARVSFYGSRRCAAPRDREDLLENRNVFICRSHLRRRECSLIREKAKRLNIVTDSTDLILKLISSGNGVGLLPDFAANENVRRLDSVGFYFDATLFAAFNDPVSSPALRAFIDFFKSECGFREIKAEKS